MVTIAVLYLVFYSVLLFLNHVHITPAVYTLYTVFEETAIFCCLLELLIVPGF